ncbi:MAG: hypothetical protein ACLFUS_16470, partial [Candidatus Sumerlaeia bacterium]
LVDGEPVFSLLGEKKSPLGLQGGFVRLYATVRRLEDKQAYLRISPMGTSAYHVATSAFSEHKLEFHITRLLRTWVTQESGFRDPLFSLFRWNMPHYGIRLRSPWKNLFGRARIELAPDKDMWYAVAILSYWQMRHYTDNDG